MEQSSVYIQCTKCNHKLETMKEFDEEYKKGKWYIGVDGWTWEYVHNCASEIY